MNRDKNKNYTRINPVKNKISTGVKWYFRPLTVIIAILFIGPLALPLLWMSPAFKKRLKTLITILTIVLTLCFIKVSVDLYRTLLNHIRELEKVLSPAACAQKPEAAEKASLADGTYEDGNAMVRIAVTVKNGDITNIKILEHRGGGKKYHEMIEPLAKEIIGKQSTRVDSVTGATVSSNALKEAVDEALKKASSNKP